MKKWEKSLKKFLEKWENKKEVIGAIVCGSYITGNPSKHSDIDIHIFLDSKTKWRERGNEVIDGILIEYFANPIRQHYKYAIEDYKKRRKINSHMISTGKLLFDKTGELKKLIKDSKKYLIKEYPEQNKIQTEIAKYHLWDMCDNLEEVFESKGEEFYFVIYNDLNNLFDTYAKFLRYDYVAIHKIKRFLIDKKDQKKYLVKEFPDKHFVKLYLKILTLKNKSEMMKEYKELTKYVLKKMGGFNINGWKIRTPAQ